MKTYEITIPKRITFSELHIHTVEAESEEEALSLANKVWAMLNMTIWVITQLTMNTKTRSKSRRLYENLRSIKRYKNID
jgi:1,2-phenylacetyl-CoA epoxidase PaaB subunit